MQQWAFTIWQFSQSSPEQLHEHARHHKLNISNLMGSCQFWHVVNTRTTKKMSAQTMDYLKSYNKQADGHGSFCFWRIQEWNGMWFLLWTLQQQHHKLTGKAFHQKKSWPLILARRHPCLHWHPQSPSISKTVTQQSVGILPQTWLENQWHNSIAHGTAHTQCSNIILIRQISWYKVLSYWGQFLMHWTYVRWWIQWTVVCWATLFIQQTQWGGFQHNSPHHSLISSMSMHTSIHCLLVSLARDYSYRRGRALASGAYSELHWCSVQPSRHVYASTKHSYAPLSAGPRFGSTSLLLRRRSIITRNAPKPVQPNSSFSEPAGFLTEQSFDSVIPKQNTVAARTIAPS